MEFVVVHNGSIDNYSQIRDFLESLGFIKKLGVRKHSNLSGNSLGQPSSVIHVETDRPNEGPLPINSETDTEMLAKMCDYIYTKIPEASFPVIVGNCFRLIEGSASTIYKSRFFPDECVATRLVSPLVLGFKYNRPFKRENKAKTVNGFNHISLNSFDGTFTVFDTTVTPDYIIPPPDEIFISSDAQSFCEETCEVLYLHDYDIVHFTKQGIIIYNIGNDPDETRNIVHIPKSEVYSILPKDTTNFTISEIKQQPEILQKMVNRYVNFDDNTVNIPGINEFLPKLQKARRFIFIGSGSSYNAVIASRTVLEDFIPSVIQFEFSCEYNERDCRVSKNDVCVFVSQSGETADTLLALSNCHNRNAFCIGITNTRGSSLTRNVDFACYTDVGVEYGVASTKTFTANLIMIILLALSIGGDVKVDEKNSIIKELKHLESTLEEAFKLDEQIEHIADKLQDQKCIMVCGRGGNYAIARETTLKLKTIACTNAESYHEGELKHGPITLIEEGMKLIFLATVPSDVSIEQYRSTLGQIHARGGYPIILSDTLHHELMSYFADEMIVLPHVIDCLQTVINVIPFQLLACHIAKIKGISPDAPRNLAKCATIQ
ncbi:Glutamine--fructose-6-phosphate aminotransferase [isomerizing] 2 [Histomonas meleagridis]|uniref:Glutamine--fructose-6-phosphate aminotransferase [isomerizing] 2 n=1 Tax=Histomonas meleagridis TaxID=135588 RepID=UPI0035597056|nr:Glutamine--fructose-6-phosphate aminotransferase [isomerizing] 2 [Histomonas meleagridis]KAH0806951.1 Glutamine--fructose-6-phosphate aminotransferase [isomerizing] 2 [Histomonas meleagridis]